MTDFQQELDEFFNSLENGSIFEGLSEDVWSLAEKVVNIPSVKESLDKF